MSQGLPLFDFDEEIISNNFDAHSNSSHFSTTDNNDFSWLEFDNESLELLWEKGQLAMQSFDSPPLGNGTIESIVNQATHQPQPTAVVDGGENTVEHHHHSGSNPAYVTMPMDLLLTCNNNNNNNNSNNNNNTLSNEYLEHPTHVLDFVPWSTRAGSCSGVVAGGDCLARAGIGWSCETNCGSATCCWGRDTCQLTLDSTTYKELGSGGTGHTSTILASSGNTFPGGEYTITTTVGEEPDFVGLSGSLAYKNDQKGDEEGIGTEAVTKKRRRAANHNQSERKRREKINQRIHTLQKMVPNSTKTDKASMLDEVIEHLKQLQAQVLGNVNMTSPMMSMQQQQLHMSMMNNNMEIATAAVPPATATAAFNPPPAAEPDPLLAYLACQSQVQPMGTDAYVRLATLYQQFQQSSNIWL